MTQCQSDTLNAPAYKLLLIGIKKAQRPQRHIWASCSITAMINTSNGHIHLPSFELTPELDLAELTNIIGGELKVDNRQNGWKWITLNTLQITERTFHFRLGFFNERLTQLYFRFETKETEDWKPWNKESELRKLELYRTWLSYEIGAERYFNWGTVLENYDGKGGFSSISIEYKPNN